MILSILSATFRQWVFLALPALGGVVSERAGVVNIALEGMMLVGAFSAVAVGSATGNTLLALGMGIIAGAVVGLLHALFVLTLRVQAILSGVGINLGALGLTTYALRVLGGEKGLQSQTLLPAEALIAATVLLIATTAFVLARTRLGILLRACGENPEAVWGAGFSVLALRYGATVVSGALAGMGGAALGLVGLGAFTQDMTAGRGYIALAAVVFGRWTPLGAALTALLFAFGDALQIALQTLGYAKIIPPDFLTLLPYLLTLGAIATKRPSKSRQK